MRALTNRMVMMTLIVGRDTEMRNGTGVRISGSGGTGQHWNEDQWELWYWSGIIWKWRRWYRVCTADCRCASCGVTN